MVAKKTKKSTARVSRRKTGMAAMPVDDFQKSKHYVQYETESREWSTIIKDYCKKNLDRKKMQCVNALPEWKIGFGSHWAVCAYYLSNNIIVPEPYMSGFKNRIDSLILEGQEILNKTKKPKTETLNVQQRVFQQSLDVCEKIEEWLEEYIKTPASFDQNSFDVGTHFTVNQVTQAHARKIKNMYEPLLTEAIAVSNLPTQAKINALKDEKQKDELMQIKEGYSGIKKAHHEAYKNALEKITNACDLIIDGAKAKRKPRKQKAPNKERLISKVKYLESDPKYQITSVNPLELLESKEVWVFNTKTRKLGHYVADATSGIMSVKGTTLVGFDEEKSLQKTLRKPEEKLKEFKNSGKVRLRKFMEEIQSVETKLTGRLNSDTVILKTTK